MPEIVFVPAADDRNRDVSKCEAGGGLKFSLGLTGWNRMAAEGRPLLPEALRTLLPHLYRLSADMCDVHWPHADREIERLSMLPGVRP